MFDSELGKHIKIDQDMRKAVVIEPKVKGKYNWLSNSLLEFNPDNNWPEETEFSVKLTKKLLHHPQQHFVKEQDEFKFNTSKNLVYLSQIKQDKDKREKGITHVPNSPLELSFSKNMTALPKSW